MSPNKRIHRFWLSYGLATTTFLLVFFTILMSASAQTEPQPLPPVAVQGAEFLGEVEPFTSVSLSSLPSAPTDYTGPIIERSRRGVDQPLRDLPGVPMVDGPDPLAAQQLAASEQQERVFSSKILNIDGQGYTGVNPSDNVGDVGLTEYVQLVNQPSGTKVAVYNKFTGGLLQTILLSDLAPLGSNCRLNAVGQPIVLFDPYAQRWIMSEAADDPFALCIYISQTSSLIGAYNAYQFNVPNFPDAPKLSVWHDAYYVTASEETSGGTYTPVIYALERADMLAGKAATILRVSATPLAGFNYQVLTPADSDGLTLPPANEPAAFLRHVDDEAHDTNPILGQDRLELWQYRPDFAKASASVLMGPTHITVSDFDSEFCASSFACIPQPSNSTLLDPVLEPVMWRVQYRNFGTHQTMVGSFTVGDVGTDDHERAAVRWFELRRSGSGGWGVHQQGTFTGADTKYRWLSTIAMDRFGNIALGFNASDNTLTFPSIYYTGRQAGDTNGVMTQGNILVQSGNSALSTSTWGEYNSLNVDPIDDCTFYFTANYTKGGVWATRISSFRFNNCTGVAAPTPTFSPTPTIVPPTATIAPSTVELIQNGGFEAKSSSDPSAPLAWNLSNRDKEKVRCDKPAQGKFFARTGACAFQFKGIEGEASKLKQTYAGSSTLFIEGDVIDLDFYINAPKPLVTMIAKLKVSYEDPNIKKGKNKITLTPTNGQYLFRTTSYTLVNDFVSRVQVIFDHRTQGGKLYIDDVGLVWNQIAARRTRGERPNPELVPLP